MISPPSPRPGMRGKIKISSTSNTKKITAIKKNRTEKGSRDINLGENPHSKGLYFSRSFKNFMPNPIPTPTKANAKITTNLIKIKINLNQNQVNLYLVKS